MRAADVEERAGAFAGAVAGVAIEAADADDGARALHFARRLRDHVDDAVDRVGAPHRRRRSADDFDLLDLVQVDRQEVPHDEAEEVLVEAAAVEQRELPGRQRAGRVAACVTLMSRADTWVMFTPGTARSSSAKFWVGALCSVCGPMTVIVAGALTSFSSVLGRGDDDRLLVLLRFVRLLLGLLLAASVPASALASERPAGAWSRPRVLMRRHGRRDAQRSRQRKTTDSVHTRVSCAAAGDKSC